MRDWTLDGGPADGGQSMSVWGRSVLWETLVTDRQHSGLNNARGRFRHNPLAANPESGRLVMSVWGRSVL